MLPDKDQMIENTFPQLAIMGYKITSPVNPSYNCIAWASKDDIRWWWPHENGYWPDGIEKKITIDIFIKAYNTVGFDICDSDKFEIDFEKIVIYVNENGIPTHASRMLDEKTWTSKLGGYYDISHTIDGLNGDQYGNPKVFMKRRSDISI